jgi:hypothetical protein
MGSKEYVGELYTQVSSLCDRMHRNWIVQLQDQDTEVVQAL